MGFSLVQGIEQQERSTIKYRNVSCAYALGEFFGCANTSEYGEIEKTWNINLRLYDIRIVNTGKLFSGAVDYPPRQIAILGVDSRAWLTNQPCK